MQKNGWIAGLVAVGGASLAWAAAPMPATRPSQAISPAGRWVAAAPAPAAKLQKCAYLGIATSQAPVVLRRHLKLAAGTGMVVNFVDPDSPAARAGIKPYDVLLKLDNQILINQDQLAVLVRMYREGDQIKLGLVRDGRPMVIQATLTEKEMPPLGVDIHPLPGDSPMGDPAAGGGWRTLRNDVVMKGEGRVVDNIRLGAGATLRISDKDYTLLIANRNGHEQLLARDPDGNIVFNGPIDTEAQRQALPPAIAARLQHVKVTLPAPATQPGE